MGNTYLWRSALVCRWSSYCETGGRSLLTLGTRSRNQGTTMFGQCVHTCCHLSYLLSPSYYCQGWLGVKKQSSVGSTCPVLLWPSALDSAWNIVIAGWCEGAHCRSLYFVHFRLSQIVVPPANVPCKYFKNVLALKIKKSAVIFPKYSLHHDFSRGCSFLSLSFFFFLLQHQIIYYYFLSVTSMLL